MSPASAESLTTYPAKKAKIARQLVTSERKTDERAVKRKVRDISRKPSLPKSYPLSRDRKWPNTENLLDDWVDYSQSWPSRREKKKLGPIFKLSSLEKRRLESGLPPDGPKTPNVARKIPPTRKNYNLQSPECGTNEKNKKRETESSSKALKTT